MKLSTRRILFKIALVVLPWLSVIFLGRNNIRRYSFAGFVIIIFEIINHKIGQKKKWWTFYGRKNNFLINELPFSIGPYMPLSMWILKFTYGNFKKFLLANVLFDGVFAFVIMDLLKKIKIIRLNKLNKLQFFVYIFYKAFILYGAQWFAENRRYYFRLLR
ncbi:hypothetical protein [Metabacillus malikii]|uniref:Uncharacterized protein n=1 Tax=Metabacillus malikii TaxID=1504265 RepID=A0ABT9ZMH7_9BACI|nr:hypothetical protein [Metabacillus malikii]MDQ0233462.1 hypothetical protein [Metabacillus malikii]